MPSNGIVQDNLNGFSGVILAVFIVVSIFVIWPVYVPVPAALRKPALRCLEKCRIITSEERAALFQSDLRFPLSLETAPVIGVVVLLATTTIDGSTIRLGIKGDDDVKPYDVLVLFISLAYISIALDGTGALEAIAFWVSKRGGNSGLRLFTYLYIFFLSTGCIVGNDPLILSGTPFLAYLTGHTNVEPTAWIFSEFMAANTASAVLVSSNPTNVLITGSFSLNYLTEFTKWTVLPSLIPAVANYPVLLLMFRKRIPKTLTPLQDDPWSKLREPKGAVFLSALMVVTVSVLVGTSFVPGQRVEVWMVTMPAGILGFLFDVASDVSDRRKRKKAVQKGESDQAAELYPVTSRGSQRRASKALLRPVTSSEPTTKTKDELSSETAQDSSPTTEKAETTQKPAHTTATTTKTTVSTILHDLAERFPGTTQTLLRLPIPLLPFAMCEFIMVRGLAQRGWIHVFAQGFANACTSPAGTVFFMGFVSAAFLCPLAGTNIGATIILVEIMRDPAFSQSAAVLDDHRVLLGAIYAVAMGSNLGAFSYTFCGSLAGLLWRGLLADKGVHVSQLKFAMVNAIPLLMQTTLACAILVGQLYWFA